MTDRVQAQLTFLDGHDDREWRKARRMQSQTRRVQRRITAAPPRPAGPCCQRCIHWDAPKKADEFGVCHHLAIVLERQRDGYDKGTVLSVNEASRSFDLTFELLPSKAWFDCSGFTAKDGGETP